jgi:methionyl-tRNA formyltransferase
VSFGYFLTPNILDALPLGAINMHPSALPRHRGPAPIIHALLDGDASTAVSVIEIARDAFDVGCLLLQEPHAIGAEDNATKLTRRLADAGGDAILRTLAQLSAARAAARPQAASGATRAPKVRADAGALRWSSMSAAEVVRRVRALEGSVGAHALLEAESAPPKKGAAAAAAAAVVAGGNGGGAAAPLKRVKILDAVLAAPRSANEPGNAAELPQDAPPGALFCDARARRLFARAADGWVELRALAPETKSPMSGADFANGLRLRGLAAPTTRLVDADASAAPLSKA